MEKKSKVDKTDLIKMQNAIIMTLADAIEKKDQNTGEHVRKTAKYVAIITRELNKKGYYKEQLNKKNINNIIYASTLHDIGKIGIPDSILNKKDKLTDYEFYKMQHHTIIGSQIIQNIIDSLPKNIGCIECLELAKEIALYHHEKWDGTGYPHGLKKEEIPLSARIIAVADVFDALTSKRIYKEPLALETCIEMIKSGSGTHFDPLIVEAFISSIDQITLLEKTNKTKIKK